MKTKILNILLIFFSLIGYLEWGKNNQSFLYEAEAEIIYTLFTNPSSALHLFTVFPLIGQILLFSTLFQKKPSKWLYYSGVFGIGILLLFMFIIGILSFNLKIILSTIPFLATAFITILHHKKNAQ